MSVLELCLLGEGKDTIRGKTHNSVDGIQVDMFSCFDFTNVVCGKKLKDSYGQKTFDHLENNDSETSDEVQKLTLYLKFPGRGQRDTPCMSIRGLQRLLMMLGGKVAAQYRALVETTFSRVMAGDRSLIKIIESNATSTEPIHQAFREALANDPLPGDDALDLLTRKRKYADLEYAERLEKLELNRTERLGMQAETQLCITKRIGLDIDLYKNLCPGGIIDDRARLVFKDSVLNSQLQITQQIVKHDDSEMPVTISTLAATLGLKFSDNDYPSIGKKIKKAYTDMYGTPPPMHEQLCGGAVRLVCSYTKKHTAMMIPILQAYHAAACLG